MGKSMKNRKDPGDETGRRQGGAKPRCVATGVGGLGILRTRSKAAAGCKNYVRRSPGPKDTASVATYAWAPNAALTKRLA